MKFNLFKRKNKKAWVKILEVFISIILLAGALFLVLNRNVFTGEVTQEINDKIENIIRAVQVDDSLRKEILQASLPVEWEDFESSGLSNTRNEIISKTSPNLICEAKVCYLEDNCINSNAPNDRNIYTKIGYISADLNTYSPRQLKVFCWKK